MIKFRLLEKLFRRCEIKKWEDILSIDEDSLIISFVETTKNYERGMASHGSATKKIIRRFLQDLKDGYYYVDPPGKDDDTEYLDQLSDERSKGFLVYSKRIGGDDRFCYMIYPPALSQPGIYSMKIKVYSCKGHTRHFDLKEYFDPNPRAKRRLLEEINQWRVKRGLQPFPI